MTRHTFLFLLIFTLGTARQTYAQTRTIDSLFTLIKNTKSDTTIISYLNELSWEFRTIGQHDSALYCGNEALNLANHILKNERNVSIKLAAKKRITSANNNIGAVYYLQGNYPKALEYYLNALKINEERVNKKGMAANLSNIGLVYWKQENYSKALENYFKALELYRETDLKDGLATTNGNIGIIYSDQGNQPEALKYYFQALSIYEKSETKNIDGIARNLGNIGTTYQEQGKYTEAIDYYLKALKLHEQLENQASIALNLNNIGTVYQRQHKYDQAEIYLKNALSISEKIGSLDLIQDVHYRLGQLYLTKGNFKNAYEHQQKYIIAKDSLFNIEKEQDITRKEMNYEFEKKESIARVEQEKKEALARETLKRQKLATYSFAGGGVFLLFLGLMAVRGYRIKQKANRQLIAKNAIIEEQKKLVEEKNREITDSISYALRIQTAILPPQRIMKQYLEDSFILYKPKDIVAGDFYWMETVDDLILFAACDCTGHGVPGAMVSVVCHNALNRAVREFGLTQPSSILDKTKEIVIENFAKSEEDIKDGMDISLCAYYPKTQTLQWAGANNPLWLIKNCELTEIKADKQPIGINENSKPFTNHQFKLNKNDSIYLFTDGFADQFGGETGGKKLTRKRFKELLLSIQDKQMQEQGIILDNFIVNYRKEVEQIDDILVMGVRVRNHQLK